MQSVESPAEGSAYQQYVESARESVSEYGQKAREAYDDSPVLFCLAAFGIGMGVGAALSASLASPRSRRFDEQAASFGRRMMDAVQEHLHGAWEDYVPKSLKK
jgi:hypothetical protein